MSTVLLAAGDWLKMAALSSFDMFDRSFKLILSGDRSVGKNSIIMRFVYDTCFQAAKDNTMALDGGFYS